MNSGLGLYEVSATPLFLHFWIVAHLFSQLVHSYLLILCNNFMLTPDVDVFYVNSKTNLA